MIKQRKWMKIIYRFSANFCLHKEIYNSKAEKNCKKKNINNNEEIIQECVEKHNEG